MMANTRAHAWDTERPLSGQEEDLQRPHLLAPSLANPHQQARVKALQQLALSEDSPFNLEGEPQSCDQSRKAACGQQLETNSRQAPTRGASLGETDDCDDELKRLTDEKARMLREETEEIKRQLDLMRIQLNELHRQPATGRCLQSNGPNEPEGPSGACSACCRCQQRAANLQPKIGSQSQATATATPMVAVPVDGQGGKSASGEKRHEFLHNQQLTSADSQFFRGSSSEALTASSSQGPLNAQAGGGGGGPGSPPRLRPLTGKTDCPNCACDRRRSVCDRCMEFQKQTVVVQFEGQSGDLMTRQPSFISEQQIETIVASDSEHRACLNVRPPSPSPGAQACAGRVKPLLSYKDYDERPIRPAKHKLEDVLETAIPGGGGGGGASRTQHDHSHDHERGGPGVADQAVVPGKLYTIGKSLNEKRTKLAQAIEDLQLMMEKVKKRGERLEQERKVAQLYKGQWKFGPTIGGGPAAASSLSAAGRRGSSESLRGTAYQSRLDPNLARDSNSMMGFQHVGPLVTSGQHAQQAPRPKPRLSKLNSSRLANASTLYRRPTRASTLHARSRSIESLHSHTGAATANSVTARKHTTPGGEHSPQASRIKAQPTRVAAAAPARRGETSHQEGKNAPGPGLASVAGGGEPLDSSSSSAAVDEDLEQEEIREDDENEQAQRPTRDSRPGSGESLSARYANSKSPESAGARAHDRTDSTPVQRACEQQKSDEQQQQQQHHQQQLPLPPLQQESQQMRHEQQPREATRRRTWVPVFGETEIKTIDRRRPAPATPHRKVVVFRGQSAKPIAGSSGKSILRTGGRLAACSDMASVGRRDSPGDRVLSEATKKLQFASDLLEREEHESRTKNQLIVSRTRFAPPPRSNSTMAPLRTTAGKQRHAGGAPAARPAAAAAAAAVPPGTTRDERSDTAALAASDNNAAARDILTGASMEIARLEEMIAEQQALLLRLTRQSSLQAAPLVCCLRHHDHNGHQHRHPSSSPAGGSSARSSTVEGQQARSGPTSSAGRQLINNLRERLNKTKAKLTRTLEQERAKYQQLEQRVDSSLRKQSDLENENKLLKLSLNKCLDTCLRDILSTFESLSDTLGEPLQEAREPNRAAACASAGDAQVAASECGDDGDVSPLLGNAAQLIADNRHLKRMRSHIESIERQRRAIFEELNQERSRSEQLELALRESKLELEQVAATRARLESQFPEAAAAATTSLASISSQAPEPQPVASTSKQAADSEAGRAASAPSQHHQQSPQVSMASAAGENQQQQQQLSEPCNSCNVMTTSSANDDTTSLTYNSIDTYRQYIQSMTPDLDAIRRERRMILDDFDNIKKMLSDIDNN